MTAIHNYTKHISWLSALPAFEEIAFGGEIEPKIFRYEGRTSASGISRTILTTMVIRSEEGFVWASFSELFGRAVKDAAEKMRGFYGFTLLSLDLSNRIEAFDASAFATLLGNHGRKLTVGESAVIPFGACCGILKKRMEESWGKIDVTYPLQVFRKAPSELDALVKKMFKLCLATGEHAIISRAVLVISDLSRTPLFQFGEEIQTERLRTCLHKGKAALGERFPEIYVCDRNGRVELGAQFQI